MRRISMFVFGLTAMSGICFADQIGFASTILGELYRVDLTTATATLIGNTGISFFMEGLAFSPGGTLYGTDSGSVFSNSELYSINTSTAVATPIGNTGVGDIEGLDFNGNTLVGSSLGSPTSLFTIDTATASTTLLTSANVGSVRSLTDVDSNTVLVINGSGGAEQSTLVNLTTGATTAIGPLNSLSNFIVAEDKGTDGVLYALDSAGNAYTVDGTNGLSTLIGNTGNHFFLDLSIQGATTATPEPATFVLVASACLVLAGLRKRSHSRSKIERSGTATNALTLTVPTSTAGRKFDAED